MANSRMTEGVGKKIVEALKMQSDIEINPVQQPVVDDFVIEQEIHTDKHLEENSFTEKEPAQDEFNFDESILNDDFSTVNETEPEPTMVMPKLDITPQQTSLHSELDDFEIPSNVAVLKQLITKLPAGVTKQTGALIIKQTMEALGISMKSVLQEAQQVQEGLNNSSRECQASIMEYKKQIGILEKQAQKYQRQYAALNDIISLFVQTSI